MINAFDIVRENNFIVLAPSWHQLYPWPTHKSNFLLNGEEGRHVLY